MSDREQTGRRGLPRDRLAEIREALRQVQTATDELRREVALLQTATQHAGRRRRNAQKRMNRLEIAVANSYTLLEKIRDLTEIANKRSKNVEESLNGRPGFGPPLRELISRGNETLNRLIVRLLEPPRRHSSTGDSSGHDGENSTLKNWQKLLLTLGGWLVALGAAAFQQYMQVK